MDKFQGEKVKNYRRLNGTKAFANNTGNITYTLENFLILVWGFMYLLIKRAMM